MSNTIHNHHVPTIAEVDQIATLSDPVIRNLQITQCYHELSAVAAERTGQSANWCTFATWASKQAGQTIRKEDLVRALESMLNTAPSTTKAARGVATIARHMGAKHDIEAIQKSVRDVLNPAEAFDRASNAVGKGNKKVFEEIGREFARFFSTCLHDATFDADKIVRFCDELRPGEPPDGQRYLRQAFTRYYQAFFEPNAKMRAELLLLANIEIGFHEQTRLQPEITESLDTAFVDPKHFTLHLFKAVFPYGGWLIRGRLFYIRLLSGLIPLDEAVNTLIDAARRQIRMIITEHLMTIGFPHGVRLRLGEDLNAEFPPSLQQITNPDLRALLDQIDPTPDSLHETGATDWADLTDRIHFIIDMFRCYQEYRDLFDPPFNPDQVVALKTGHLPGGQL